MPKTDNPKRLLLITEDDKEPKKLNCNPKERGSLVQLNAPSKKADTETNQPNLKLTLDLMPT